MKDMIIDKIFEVQLNLTNINDIFSSNLEQVILIKIKNIYEKKCFQSCYIIEITDIIERSHLSVDKRSLTCGTTVDVKFSAKVIIYEYLEVVNNNVIENITKKRIECRTERTASYINISNQDLNTLEVGQIIPIRVGKATYQPMQLTISINSFPFIPVIEPDTYYKIEPLSNEEKEILSSTIIQSINEVHEDLKMVSKDRVKFFKNMLHPYKTVDPIKKNTNVVDLLNLDASGVVCLSNKLDLSNHTIIVENTYENPFLESSIIVYKIYLNTYLKHIKNIFEMSTIYKDDEVFDSHQNVFKIYEKYKLKN